MVLAAAVLVLSLVVVASGGLSRIFRNGSAPASTPTPAATAARALSIQPMPGSQPLEGIEGFAVGSSGTVYVSDFRPASHRSRIVAVTPKGGVTTLVEGAATWNAGFRAIGADASGTVYAVAGQEIRKIGENGRMSTLAGKTVSDSLSTTSPLVDGEGPQARFGIILGMAVSPQGDLYVTDSGWVRKVTPQGRVETLPTCGASTRRGVGPGCLGWPGTIAVDAGGTIYIGSDDYAIRRVTPEGQVTVLAQGATSGTGLFHRIYGLAVDPADATILAADSSGLHKVSPDGTVEPVAEDTAAHLGRIAIAKDGTVYAVQDQRLIVTIRPT